MERLLCNYLSCACTVFTENCTEIRLANIGLHKEIVSPHIYLGLIFLVCHLRKLTVDIDLIQSEKTLRFSTSYFEYLLPSSELGNIG